MAGLLSSVGVSVIVAVPLTVRNSNVMPSRGRLASLAFGFGADAGERPINGFIVFEDQYVVGDLIQLTAQKTAAWSRCATHRIAQAPASNGHDPWAGQRAW